MNDRFRLTIIGAALVAPLLMLASTLAYIANGKGISEGEVAGTLQLWAFAAFGVALVGLARLGERQRPGLSTAVVVFGVLGAVGGAAYSLDAIAAGAYGVSVQDVGTGVTPLALRLPGVAFPVALILLAVLLVRQQDVPRVAALLLAAEGLTFPAARIPDISALAVVSDCLGVAALTLVAVHLYRSSQTVAASAERSVTLPPYAGMSTAGLSEHR